MIKPKKDAYEYVLNTYNLGPKECIFIDDQCSNILAADSVSITELLLCHGDYNKVRAELIKLGVFLIELRFCRCQV